jgi:16S rRNA (guanine527-N7)-methyltransferase
VKNRLIKLLEDNFLEVNPDSLPGIAEHLVLFLNEWKRWSLKINLTAETDELSVINKHIYESLQYTRAISSHGSLVDIGSGSGFPAIPIKAMFPKLDVFMIESQRKRANFLKAAIRSMGLSAIQCLHGRIEDFPEFLGRYDFVTFRHVLEPNLSLELGSSLLNEDGSLLLQTSFNKTFKVDFLDTLCLYLAQEIYIKKFSSSHSKIMVFKRIKRII